MSAITDLDRRLSRALECGRGIRLSDAELDMLAEAGAIDAVREMAAKDLKERVKCRDVQRRRESISAVSSGSIGIESEMEAFAPPSSPSSGMTQSAAASEAFQLLTRGVGCFAPERIESGHQRADDGLHVPASIANAGGRDKPRRYRHSE